MAQVMASKSGDENIVISKGEYEYLKNGIQQVMLAWLSEPEAKARLQRCADFAIDVLHKDLTLRVPRSFDQRENGFAVWRNVWHDRLGTVILEEFQRQFPGIVSHLSPDVIRATVVESLWPQIEAELLAFAVEGLARAWVRRRMGDATVIRRPKLEGVNWVVPLGIQGREDDLGRVVLDRDGNVIEEISSSRNDILARVNG